MGLTDDITKAASNATKELGDIAAATGKGIVTTANIAGKGLANAATTAGKGITDAASVAKEAADGAVMLLNQLYQVAKTHQSTKCRLKNCSIFVTKRPLMVYLTFQNLLTS